MTPDSSASPGNRSTAGRVVISFFFFLDDDAALTIISWFVFSHRCQYKWVIQWKPCRLSSQVPWRPDYTGCWNTPHHLFNLDGFLLEPKDLLKEHLFILPSAWDLLLSLRSVVVLLLVCLLHSQITVFKVKNTLILHFLIFGIKCFFSLTSYFDLNKAHPNLQLSL